MRTATTPTTRQLGNEGENQALDHLQRQGLRLLVRNYRVAGGPRVRGGEIDLVMQDRDGTVVFVEVRQRTDARFGGAAASVTHAKQQRLVRTAQHFLRRWRTWPPCRFDVVALEGSGLQWIRGAFEAG